MNVAFVTFGCRLNRAEALDHEARYTSQGHTVISLDSGTNPDLIILRGCSVTAKAQRDCEKQIDHLRQRFPNATLHLTGCLPSRSTGTAPKPSVDPQDPISLRTSRAYLKVQDGCSGKCAFCIVPTFRGPPRSVPFQEILARAKTFLSAGFRELVVTGCNLALYRASDKGLPELLAALAELGTDPNSGGSVPLHRIRLGSLEPGICDEKILSVFEKHVNICRFIHLSIQSGADDVLRRMNRPYAVAEVAAFCAEARRRLGPRLTLGADIIAGFPGEAADDHERTRLFLSEAGITNLHVFPYSERPGTPAATMSGAIPLEIRRQRAKELEREGQARRETFLRAFVGQSVQVCVENGNDHGWSAEYLPCRLNTPQPRRSLVTGMVSAIADGILHVKTNV